MISINDVIFFYTYFYKKKYNKKETIKINKTNINLINGFINRLDKRFNIKSLGQNFLFKYFLFSFMNLEDMNILSYNKKIRLSMIVGKPAFDRFLNRNKDFDFLLFENNDYIKKYNIKRSELFKQEKKEYLFLFEEQIKKLYYNTTKGLLICSTQTTMYNKHHNCCILCKNKKECKELQRVNYPNIYNERNR